MATLYVTEFAALTADADSGAMTGHCPPLAEQTVAIAGSSAPSAA